MGTSGTSSITSNNGGYWCWFYVYWCSTTRLQSEFEHEVCLCRLCFVYQNVISWYITRGLPGRSLVEIHIFEQIEKFPTRKTNFLWKGEDQNVIHEDAIAFCSIFTLSSSSPCTHLTGGRSASGPKAPVPTEANTSLSGILNPISWIGMTLQFELKAHSICIE